MKKLYIIRGLPGSGKSTFAEVFLKVDPWEADDYFLGPDGEYDFDFSLLGQAHSWCMSSVIEDMAKGTPCVCVSNTFTQLWEFQSYLAAAKVAGYEVEVYVTTNDFENNVHGVPPEAIARMRARWEAFPGETILGKQKRIS